MPNYYHLYLLIQHFTSNFHKYFNSQFVFWNNFDKNINHCITTLSTNSTIYQKLKQNKLKQIKINFFLYSSIFLQAYIYVPKGWGEGGGGGKRANLWS